MFLKTISSLSELEETGKNLINTFSDKRIFAFYGNMGAGKTTFIQAICKVLGSSDYVTSPTFALINEYSAGDSSPIYHFDFYRIKNIEEAFDIGYEEYLYSEKYCFIEWPEKIEEILPTDIIKVKIEVVENETRKISAEEV